MNDMEAVSRYLNSYNDFKNQLSNIENEALRASLEYAESVSFSNDQEIVLSKNYDEERKKIEEEKLEDNEYIKNIQKERERINVDYNEYIKNNQDYIDEAEFETYKQTKLAALEEKEAEFIPEFDKSKKERIEALNEEEKKEMEELNLQAANKTEQDSKKIDDMNEGFDKSIEAVYKLIADKREEIKRMTTLIEAKINADQVDREQLLYEAKTNDNREQKINLYARIDMISKHLSFLNDTSSSLNDYFNLLASVENFYKENENKDDIFSFMELNKEDIDLMDKYNDQLLNDLNDLNPTRLRIEINKDEKTGMYNVDMLVDRYRLNPRLVLSEVDLKNKLSKYMNAFVNKVAMSTEYSATTIKDLDPRVKLDNEDLGFIPFDSVSEKVNTNYRLSGIEEEVSISLEEEEKIDLNVDYNEEENSIRIQMSDGKYYDVLLDKYENVQTIIEDITSDLKDNITVNFKNGELENTLKIEDKKNIFKEMDEFYNFKEKCVTKEDVFDLNVVYFDNEDNKFMRLITNAGEYYDVPLDNYESLSKDIQSILLNLGNEFSMNLKRGDTQKPFSVVSRNEAFKEMDEFYNFKEMLKKETTKEEEKPDLESSNKNVNPSLEVEDVSASKEPVEETKPMKLYKARKAARTKGLKRGLYILGASAIGLGLSVFAPFGFAAVVQLVAGSVAGGAIGYIASIGASAGYEEMRKFIARNKLDRLARKYRLELVVDELNKDIYYKNSAGQRITSNENMGRLLQKELDKSFKKWDDKVDIDKVAAVFDQFGGKFNNVISDLTKPVDSILKDDENDKQEEKQENKQDDLDNLSVETETTTLDTEQNNQEVIEPAVQTEQDDLDDLSVETEASTLNNEQNNQEVIEPAVQTEQDNNIDSMELDNSSTVVENPSNDIEAYTNGMTQEELEEYMKFYESFNNNSNAVNDIENEEAKGLGR